MSAFEYKCENCGVVSTPDNRIPFITEYECAQCIGKVTGEAKTAAQEKWREIYRNMGWRVA